jgi:DMSO/TMAO reductase YedYZ molybdopterin-dependent catalytic subunit
MKSRRPVHAQDVTDDTVSVPRRASIGHNAPMSEETAPRVDAPPPAGTIADEAITRDELALAVRNHGMPLEAMRWDVTPVGLHYLLTHYDVPAVDPATWRLRIAGAVERPLELTLDDLRARPTVTRRVTMECAGNGRARLSPRAFSQPWVHEAIGTGEWTGTPLRGLLDEAGLTPDVADVVFTGLDRGVEGGVEQSYQRALTPAQIDREDALLVHVLNGAPLPPQHGFPLRLVVPGWYGMTNVKWLHHIAASTEPFTGYQQAQAYRLRSQPGEPGTEVRHMRVRSLMIPPGTPGFPVRQRFVRPGTVTLTGRAWSGAGAVTRVEVSTDGGGTWADAELEPARSPAAWQGWRTTWDAVDGRHELVCRATDESGDTQPLDHRWNLGGYAVNTVHRVPVVVTSDPSAAAS